MRNAQAAHLKDKNRIRDGAPIGTALARDIHDGDIFDAGSNWLPSLLKGDAPENNRISGHRAGIVMGEMTVAQRHRIGLNPGCHIEIGVGNHFSLATGMDQKTRMAVPLKKVGAERGTLRRRTAARLYQMTPVVQQMDQGGIAKSFSQTAERQYENRRQHADQAAPLHFASSTIDVVKLDIATSGNDCR